MHGRPVADALLPCGRRHGYWIAASPLPSPPPPQAGLLHLHPSPTALWRLRGGPRAHEDEGGLGTGKEIPQQRVHPRLVSSSATASAILSSSPPPSALSAGSSLQRPFRII
ncbi:uncharacterized protein LOC106866448 isoform X3 [Brachypodium distachyon]|uniref:uncharacterized protein LOC106866448 isoform X3 n=1 Tax=Brachypodium distachyon TaxID=15368 RepID=UPI00071CFEE6|nr:uncharacterized protein LOC106866448 isoform X3 [Brachypodium distachyon]|eukprot:XP_014756170.1 uncharacterized protein LOC106866448 isoform X3 [Brachypodium distachyon]